MNSIIQYLHIHNLLLKAIARPAMKKWKILNDSDKESQSSSRHVKAEQNTSKDDSKTHHKGYIPLKRSKNVTAQGVTTPRAINSEKELYLPVFSHRYIKYDSTSSTGSKRRDRDRDKDKMKTEWYGDGGLELGDKNFQEIQQNFMRNSEGMRMSERGGSMVLKRNEDDFYKYMSQRQTEREFFKEPSIGHHTEEQQSLINLNFKRKQKNIPSLHLKSLKTAIQGLSRQQRDLKQQIKLQLNSFSVQLKNNQGRINKKLTENSDSKQRNQAINQILQEYQHYRPKIEQLQEQKQVFLQTLIRMAPI